ncbi:hypothetical protein GCM10010919_01010 [Alishewanella longhuensis]|uniref:HTH LytTR-type domain-containing protein n=2 Tax=Alishewanella longhuensis TaxID=1091037 RepID=A0ABQ3KXL5_9ALTE|nr:hypothetical protein GCM10010919_01010 [Alishewanella longhuensis]
MTDIISYPEFQQPVLLFCDMDNLSIREVETVVATAALPGLVLFSSRLRHGITALKLGALDLIIKPITLKRLSLMLTKLTAFQVNQQYNQRPESSDYPTRLTIREPGRLKIINIDDICRISSAGNYVEIHVYPQNKVYLQRNTLSAVMEKLDPTIFARIHRTSIVRKDDIVELRPGYQGDAEVLLRCGTKLIMSRRYRHTLFDFFEQAS